MPRSTPSGKEPLSRARVLRAAIALADAEGIEKVSMRRLAETLGVVPMALYKHVADKDDLVDCLLEYWVCRQAVLVVWGEPYPDANFLECFTAARELVALGDAGPGVHAKDAIRKFQARHGLKVDGNAGLVTRGRLLANARNP